ncbi:hypothetical protein [Vogesella indigofera]|uniref:hypothetical protein n=1 Tax=Vogesella indigofera TaxID=45465 RepID=UPI003F6DF380
MLPLMILLIIEGFCCINSLNQNVLSCYGDNSRHDGRFFLSCDECLRPGCGGGVEPVSSGALRNAMKNRHIGVAVRSVTNFLLQKKSSIQDAAALSRPAEHAVPAGGLLSVPRPVA